MERSVGGGDWRESTLGKASVRGEVGDASCGSDPLARKGRES